MIANDARASHVAVMKTFVSISAKTNTRTETTNWQLVTFIYFCGSYMSPGDYLEDYLPGITLCLKIVLA